MKFNDLNSLIKKKGYQFYLNTPSTHQNFMVAANRLLHRLHVAS